MTTNTPLVGSPPSSDYLALANLHLSKGVAPSIVSHSEVLSQRATRRLRFVRDDGSGLGAVDSKHRAPVLVPGTEPGESAMPPTTPTIQELELRPEAYLDARPDTSPPQPAEAPSEPPVVAVKPAPPAAATPKFVVEFVGDIVDLQVACHEVSWSEESSMLALLIPSGLKLKLVAGGEIRIRCPVGLGPASGEKLYWFTGIVLPVRVMNSSVVVFGGVQDQS